MSVRRRDTSGAEARFVVCRNVRAEARTYPRGKSNLNGSGNLNGSLSDNLNRSGNRNGNGNRNSNGTGNGTARETARVDVGGIGVRVIVDYLWRMRGVG